MTLNAREQNLFANMIKLLLFRPGYLASGQSLGTPDPCQRGMASVPLVPSKNAERPAIKSRGERDSTACLWATLP
jgi:hypothetical protein